jgi:O-antigen ligase
VIAQQRWLGVWPLLVAVAVALVWPLTAYKASPFLLPAFLIAAGAVVLIAERPEYGIALAVALAPLTNIRILGIGGDAVHLPGKPLHLVIPAVAFSVLLYGPLVSRAEREAAHSPWLVASVIAFVGVAIAASIQALEPSQSVNKMVLLLTAAALFFAVFQVCQERRQLVVVVAGAVMGLLLASLQGVVQHYTGQFGEFGFVSGGSIVKRVQGSFGHPNQYGGFVAVLLPLAVAMLFTKKAPQALRWVSALAAALGVLALTFSYARGAIAAVVLGSIIWLAVVRPRLAFVATVCVAIAAIGLAPGALKQRFNAQGATSDVPLRADIWQSALDIYSARPLLGVGVDNFSVAYTDLPSSATTASQRRLLHQTDLLTPPHAQNLYLNVMAEEGIIGLVALLFLGGAAVAVVYRGSRVRDPIGRAICIGVGAGIATLGVHSFLEAGLLGEVALPLFSLLAVAAAFVGLDSTEAAEGAG